MLLPTQTSREASSMHASSLCLTPSYPGFHKCSAAHQRSCCTIQCSRHNSGRAALLLTIDLIKTPNPTCKARAGLRGNFHALELKMQRLPQFTPLLNHVHVYLIKVCYHADTLQFLHVVMQHAIVGPSPLPHSSHNVTVAPYEEVCGPTCSQRAWQEKLRHTGDSLC